MTETLTHNNTNVLTAITDDEEALLLLAHPDDEIFFAPVIARVPRVTVVYMTDGARGGACSTRTREAEARGALACLGWNEGEVEFLGAKAGFADGALHASLPEAWRLARQWAQGRTAMTRIFTHAWEGGHQDHDACHALAVALGRAVGATVFQVGCYRRILSGIPPFVAMAPLAENGACEWIALRAREVGAMLQAIAQHRSQWMSWLGLGGPLAARMLARCAIPVQQTSGERITQRPHAGALLYEVRGGPRFEEVLDASRALEALARG